MTASDSTDQPDRPAAQRRTLLAQAERLLDEQRPDEALEVYDEILRLAPTCASAFRGRGRCLALLGQPDRALANYERAATLEPRDPEAWFLRGCLAQQRGDHDSALRDFQRALSLRVESRTWFAIGKLQAELGEDFEAIDAFGRAFELDHRAIEALVERARLFMAHECHVAALADYSTCCLMQPNEARHYVARGNAHYELDDLERAIADYETALELDPALPEVYLNLGCIALDKDTLPRAIQHFNQAIAMDPGYARAYLNRGLAHFYREHDKAAERDLLQAVTLDPLDSDASFALGRLYARQRRYRAAAEYVTSALERCPDYVDELAHDELFVELRKLNEIKRVIERAHGQLT